RLEFERPDFARPTADGGMQVETNLFREALASLYTPLSTRTLPLFVGYERVQHYELRLELPEERETRLRSRAGSWDYESKFGRFHREVKLDGHTLHIKTDISLPVQRIAVDEYGAFQKWAQDVEQSGVLFFNVRP
ncbi:MAG: hypothetical protein ACNA8W_20365, partial [Bradymonadaceae bacterium]